MSVYRMSMAAAALRESRKELYDSIAAGRRPPPKRASLVDGRGPSHRTILNAFLHLPAFGKNIGRRLAKDLRFFAPILDRGLFEAGGF